MSGIDWVVAPRALLGVVLSVATIIWFVPAPGLVAVSLLAIGMAAYDFLRTALWPDLRDAPRSR